MLNLQVRAGENPDRGKMSRRPDTEPCMARGTVRCEAWGKELAGRNASEGIGRLMTIGPDTALA